VIRHTLVEGWLLLRQRAVVSLTLALAIAVPIALAGVTLALSRWLGPLVDSTRSDQVVAVLLHPDLGADAQQRWISQLERAHPAWQPTQVPQDQLVDRLIHWFPYMQDVLDADGAAMLPPLVELTSPELDALDQLRTSPEVLAVGPGSSVERILAMAVGRVGWLLVLLSAALIAAAALLTAVWVHLELYRHADELTIMRLIGATEAAVRGPFLLAVVTPGLLAAAISCWGTTALARQLTQLVTGLGLPPVAVPTGILTLQCLVALLLPLICAHLTLARHARFEIET
jgi:cell division protein FtsX